MPTWGRAFRGAAAVVAFGILWVILGLFLTLVGLMMIGVGLFSAPFAGGGFSGPSAVPGLLGLVFGVILLIAGIALMLLGFLASFLKVVSEMTAEEVAARSMRVPRVVFDPAPPPLVHRIEPPPPPDY